MEIICTKNLKKEKKNVLSVHLLAKYKNICEEKWIKKKRQGEKHIYLHM